MEHLERLERHFIPSSTIFLQTAVVNGVPRVPRVPQILIALSLHRIEDCPCPYFKDEKGECPKRDKREDMRILMPVAYVTY